jgi:hypothetical protein
VVIELGQFSQGIIAGFRESLNVVGSPGGALGGVMHEVLHDQRVGKLLRKDRCDADRELERHTLFVQVIQRVEQWQVGLSNGFMNPFLAMRPHSCLTRVGNV